MLCFGTTDLFGTAGYLCLPKEVVCLSEVFMILRTKQHEAPFMLNTRPLTCIFAVGIISFTEKI